MADEFTKAALYGIKTFNKKVKEKIGMEKLIELLNEFEIEREEKIDLFNDKEKPLWEWYKDCTGDLTFEPTDSKILNGEAFSGDTANSVIISKSYGFIGWLVENDKIDRDSEDYPIKRHGPYFDDDVLGIIQQNCNTYEDDIKKCYSDYETLLMLLAIQEQPIDFLCSILN